MGAVGDVVELRTVPGPVRLDLAKTAVIVVDMQNDFGAPGGMFDRAGIDISGIRAVIPTVHRVLAAAREHGLQVVYLKMGFRADLADAGLPDAPNWRVHQPLGVGDAVEAPDGRVGRILVRDTWNTEIVDGLTPEAGDWIVDKHRYSGFFGTDLDERLRLAGIRHLVLVGCTTSVCVESTFRDAMFRDYQCLLLSDCTAEPLGHAAHESSLSVLQSMFGWVAPSPALLDALERRRPASSALHS